MTEPEKLTVEIDGLKFEQTGPARFELTPGTSLNPNTYVLSLSMSTKPHDYSQRWALDAHGEGGGIERIALDDGLGRCAAALREHDERLAREGAGLSDEDVERIHAEAVELELDSNSATPFTADGCFADWVSAAVERRLLSDLYDESIAGEDGDDPDGQAVFGVSFDAPAADLERLVAASNEYGVVVHSDEDPRTPGLANCAARGGHDELQRFVAWAFPPDVASALLTQIAEVCGLCGDHSHHEHDCPNHS